MYSDIVYLYGDKFSPEAKLLDFKEELPNGKKVNQKTLAKQEVFAALCSLYADKYIDLYVEEGKILFFKTKTAKAKKLATASKATGLEKALAEQIGDNTSIRDAVRSVIRYDCDNPWGVILKFVKKQLLDDGYLKQVEKGKILFVTTHKNVANGEPKDAEKRFNEYSATIADIKTKGELFKKLHEGIEVGISSREEKPEISNA